MDRLVRGNASSSHAPQLGSAWASSPLKEQDLIRVHKDGGRRFRKAGPCLCSTDQHSDRTAAPYTVFNTWIRLGPLATTHRIGTEPEAGVSLRWLGAPRNLSSGYFPQGSAGLEHSCQGMAQATRNHVDNLACCFDADDSQEDGSYSKGLYTPLRFYVPDLLKISPRFSKACYIT